jgi:hypothetical protein
MKARVRFRFFQLAGLLMAAGPFLLFAEAEKATALASELAALDREVLSDDLREQVKQMVANHVETRLRAANQRSSLEWRGIADRTPWESYRKQRISARL